MAHVGSSVERADDPRLLTGRGRYVDDLPRPRMLHAAFVGSPHARARVAGPGAGTTGAPAAVLNAVNDALAPYGVMLTEQPLTPARVRPALARAAGRSPR